MDKPIPEGVTWPLSILEAGNWREVYMGTKHMRLEVSYPYEAWERLMAALAAAQQQGQAAPPSAPVGVVQLPEGWMRDRKEAVALAEHLENAGWRADERGDIQCFDQGSAMAAEVIRRVLIPILDGAPTASLAQHPAAALSQSQSAQAGGGEVVVETVGFIRTNSDGSRYIDWTVEGGIAAVEVGDELLISNARITDDTGAGIVCTTPPASPAAAAVPDVDMALHWIDRYAAGIDEECQMDLVCEALGVKLAAAQKDGA